MTDKQIIYDDVDVKDCIAYAKSQTVSLGDTVYKQMEKICMVKKQPCKFFDCQFKQMARDIKAKEQECETLASQLDFEVQKKECLEQECERLEKRISNYKCPMDNNADYCGHLEDYGELLGQLDQLKQALQEIKEIAQYDVYTPHTDLCIKLNWVKKKISEVKDE